ncbi:hypothetical protein MJO29_011818 [Puccinia striiformis f. sp. tritici]|nr:hypothetical protein MJO29_011818 [Puccinia striiformis f. sp. tritici]
MTNTKIHDCISYNVICNSYVWTKELIHSKACSFHAPVKEPVHLNFFVGLTGPYNQPEYNTPLINSVQIQSPREPVSALLEFTPIQYPLRDELTRQPIAWIKSLDLHITLTPDQQRSTHRNQAAYWLRCSAVQLLNNLMSNLSIKWPLLFNAPWRKLLVAIPFKKAMREYGAAIAERSVDGAQRAEIDKMPMHNDDMSTYDMLQYQTRADRVAARSINIQLHCAELPECDCQPFV